MNESAHDSLPPADTATRPPPVEADGAACAACADIAGGTERAGAGGIERAGAGEVVRGDLLSAFVPAARVKAALKDPAVQAAIGRAKPLSADAADARVERARREAAESGRAVKDDRGGWRIHREADIRVIGGESIRVIDLLRAYIRGPRADAPGAGDAGGEGGGAKPTMDDRDMAALLALKRLVGAADAAKRDNGLRSDAAALAWIGRNCAELFAYTVRDGAGARTVAGRW